MDTQKTKPKKMPKMHITILEQTKKETKTMTTNKQHNNIKLLSPKADVLAKLDYGRVYETVYF